MKEKYKDETSEIIKQIKKIAKDIDSTNSNYLFVWYYRFMR